MHVSEEFCRGIILDVLSKENGELYSCKERKEFEKNTGYTGIFTDISKILPEIPLDFSNFNKELIIKGVRLPSYHQGYLHGSIISINNQLSLHRQIEVLFHELAHYHLRHHLPCFENKAQKELQAESVSIILNKLIYNKLNLYSIHYLYFWLFYGLEFDPVNFSDGSSLTCTIYNRSTPQNIKDMDICFRNYVNYTRITKAVNDILTFGKYKDTRLKEIALQPKYTLTPLDIKKYLDVQGRAMVYVDMTTS